jgi:hypothetical protein
MWLKKLLPLALACVMCGCTGHVTPTPLTSVAVLQVFKPIPNSTAAPCPMQQSVAEHNSVYDTLRTNNPVTYKAPCDLGQPLGKVTKPLGPTPQIVASAVPKGVP